LASQVPVVSITVALVLFPRLSAAAGRGATISAEASGSGEMVEASRVSTNVFNGAVTFGLFWLGPPLLRLWLGADFANHATLVLRALAVGFGVLALGSVDQVFLQAHGRVRLSAGIFVVCGILGTAALAVVGITSGISAAAVATASALAMLGLSHMVAAARLRRRRSLGTVYGAFRQWLVVGAIGAVALSLVAFVRSPSFGAAVRVALIGGAGAATAGLARRWLRAAHSDPSPVDDGDS
jgi:O-antigen/teichoic acid export membrane protein